MVSARFSSDLSAVLVDSMGDDMTVVKAARVSLDDESLEGAEGLINHLVKMGHHSVLEHCQFTFLIHAPIFVAREFMRHRLSYNEMCLSGDTVVQRVYENSQGTRKGHSTIEHLWRNWHHGTIDRRGRTRRHPALRKIYVRSYDENTLMPVASKVVDIKKNGVKETYLVTTESGRQLRSSLDHKYFTPDGWKRLGELSVGDYLYRPGMVRKEGPPTIPPRLRQGIQVWTTHMKQFLVPAEGVDCYLCQKHVPYSKVQMDHVIPVVLDIKKALDETNLKPACAPCHRRKSNGEQGHVPRRGCRPSLRPDRIVSIAEPQSVETYDLVLEDPHHNFVANGIVVHNSGRYTKLEGLFYVPDETRPLRNVGTSARPVMADLDKTISTYFRLDLQGSCEEVWDIYEHAIKDGVANEVARMVLPVNIYTKFYASANLRQWLHFLSLRISGSGSYPQYEIEKVAEQIEQVIAGRMPLAHGAFVKNGRKV